MGEGLKVDFVEYSLTHDISDQLIAFPDVISGSNEPFSGTIIRIPFRTQDQALSSKIRKKAVNPEDILELFKEFQAEITDSLVFLKSIERVEFFTDKTQLGWTQIFNLNSIREMRESIKSAISSNFALSWGGQFEIETQYNPKSAEISTPKLLRYQVRQKVVDLNSHLTRSEDDNLKAWAIDEKAVGWIALSAPLDELQISNSPSCGRIFVTLPLPILLDDTRVNVHGMFAVRSDRRSLWNDLDERKGKNEISWNKFLIRDLCSLVWHDLLLDLAKCKSSIYEYFPLMPTPIGSLFNTLAEGLLKSILDAKSAIWRSTKGEYIPLDMGYIADGKLDPQLLQCLKNVGMPIFEDILQPIMTLIRHSHYPHTILTPAVLRGWLRQNLDVCRKLDIPSAMRILEYISGDDQMDQLVGIPLFVCRDENLRSLQKLDSDDNIVDFRGKLFVGTLEESTLFDEQGMRFLALDRYPMIISDRIESYLKITPPVLNLERFNLYWFKYFSLDILFSSSSRVDNDLDTFDMSLSGANSDWIQKLWCWLDTQPLKEVESVVQSLWLIPLENGQQLHKVSMQSRRRINKQIAEGLPPIFTHTGEGIIYEIYLACTAPFPLVHRSFIVSTHSYLRSCRQIVDETDFEALLTWITADRIEQIDDQQKDRLREHFLHAIHRLGRALEIREQEILSQLPMFKQCIPCETEFGVPYR